MSHHIASVVSARGMTKIQQKKIMALTNRPEIRIIGRCKLDTEALFEKMPLIICNEECFHQNKYVYKKIWHNHYESLYKQLDADARDNIYEKAYRRTFYDYSRFANTGLKAPDTGETLGYIAAGFKEALSEDLGAAEAMNLTFKCYFRGEGLALVSLSGAKDTFWLFPSRFVEVEEYTDYTALTGGQRKEVISGSETADDTGIMTTDSLTYSDAIALKDNAASALSVLEAEMDDVKQAKVAGLAELQAEIDKLTAQMETKKKALLDELELKKQEMESKLEEMENTIFRLDSEIYSIRCYTGEVVEVNQIKTGKAADTSSPIVFYQKMRYLDEELGRIVSIYDADFSDAKYFETLIASRDDVLEAFLPAKRSIALIKVSRTGKGFRNTEFPGLLEAFDKYHGDKVAILIRDGENLCIAWTDDDRINFTEDAFLKPETRILEEDEGSFLEQGKYESDPEYKKRIKAYQKRAVGESLGRYYVFTLLQGMLDRGLIKLPDKIKLSESKYIIFSMADGWLDDNRYGTLGDMIARCNASVKAGDAILMTSYLFARSDSYCRNDRGRGYADRTHDVHAKDKEIYPVNLIEHIAKYEYDVVYKDGDAQHHSTSLTDAEYKERFETERYAYRYENIRKIEGSDKYNYFVSLRKEYSLSGEARANFQVYPEEFINLTFMNSVWLEYVLTGSKSGHVIIGGRSVDFAYTIPYIKKALSYVRKREEVAAEYISEIDPAILQDPEWPAKLSEWMLEKDVHNFSKYQTKRFCKAYKEKQH